MPRIVPTLLPQIKRLLSNMGENIRFARLRRKLSAELVSERAGISRPTLRAVERGDPGVSLGVFVSVLASLGLAQDIAHIARNDELGRKLQDANLQTKQRAPKRKKSKAEAS